jgi:hypothetical protein
MTIPAAADGTGTTITFSGLTANIISIDGPSFTREQIDTTHLGSTTTKTSMPAKLYDPGEISCEIEFDPAMGSIIEGSSGSLAIAWASATPSTWTWTSAYCTSFKAGAQVGQRLQATVGFKLNSDYTPT